MRSQNNVQLKSKTENPKLAKLGETLQIMNNEEQCKSSDLENDFEGESVKTDPSDDVNTTDMVNAAEDTCDVCNVPKNVMPMALGLIHCFCKKSRKKKKQFIRILLDSRATGNLV